MAVDFTMQSQPLNEKSINGFQELVVMDSNGDGKRDDLFFWTPGTGANRLLTGGLPNSGVPAVGIESGNINTHYTVALNGDFDGDGRQDDLFFWRPVGGNNRTLFNQGTSWDFLTDEPTLGTVNGYTNAVAGDFDGDGSVDDLFFWNPPTGSNRLLLGTDRGRWTVVSDPVARGHINGYHRLVVGDFDEDGKQDDIFFWSPNGINRTIFLGPTRNYDWLTNSINTATVNSFDELVAGDFDSDGRNDDIMFRITATGVNRLLTGGGKGRWSVLTESISAGWVNGYGRSYVGDYDRDGKQDDLLYWSPGSGANRSFSGQWYPDLPGVTWSDGELNVVGNAMSNVIELTPLTRGYQLEIDGQTQFIPPAYMTNRKITIQGGDGNDRITNGSALPMTAWGGPGNDTLIGGSGNDVLDGGIGSDTLKGQTGNDTYSFSVAGPVFEIDSIEDPSFAGIDTLDFTSLTTTVEVDLDVSSEAASHLNRTVIFSNPTFIEIVRGGSGNDEIWGSNLGSEQLYGNGGRDVLHGRGGNDQLFGGADVDVLYGDEGNDWLEAGSAQETVDGGGDLDRDINAYRWAIDGTRPDDIRQNGSGTCWFLAALSAVSRNTDLTNRIRYLGNYRFEVTIYHRDSGVQEKQVVFFDGTVAVTDASTIQNSTATGTDEYWVLLMNRAALQSMGISYLNVEQASKAGGDITQALRAVTGRNATLEDGVRFGFLPDLTDAQYLRVIRDALARRRPVIASRTSVSHDIVVGLHAYSVVGVSGSNVRIRNPWGIDNSGITGVFTDGPNDGYVTITISQFRRVFDDGIGYV
jgi:Ca2+-binding RTX toxin-like protein